MEWALCTKLQHSSSVIIAVKEGCLQEASHVKDPPNLSTSITQGKIYKILLSLIQVFCNPWVVITPLDICPSKECETQQILGVSHGDLSSGAQLLLVFLSSLTLSSFSIMSLLPGISSQLIYLDPDSDLGEFKLRMVIQ